MIQYLQLQVLKQMQLEKHFYNIFCFISFVTHLGVHFLSHEKTLVSFGFFFVKFLS